VFAPRLALPFALPAKLPPPLLAGALLAGALLAGALLAGALLAGALLAGALLTGALLAGAGAANSWEAGVFTVASSDGGDSKLLAVVITVGVTMTISSRRSSLESELLNRAPMIGSLDSIGMPVLFLVRSLL